MLWARLLGLLSSDKSKSGNSPDINVVSAPRRTATVISDMPAAGLPHPEEKPDYSQTVENTPFDAIQDKWFEVYNVPIQYRPYWRDKIVAKITNNIAYPAGTWEQNGVRHLSVKPEWLNPGVIAHEQAHNSYALLTAEQKKEFSRLYNRLKNSDPLINLLYSINPYGLTSDIEGHAEVYRYIGERMPQELKIYYPMLF
jgi:hypothetical protein